MVYFEENDVLHLSVSDDPETASIELSPNITAEFNEQGELIGVEIINASSFIRDSILESAQARLLSLVEELGRALEFFGDEAFESGRANASFNHFATPAILRRLT